MTKNLTGHDLDALLHTAVTERHPEDEERAFAAVWSQVQAGMGDHATGPDSVAQQRLNVIGDREVATRRRRRATRSASIALAIAVASGGTAAAAAFLSTRTGTYSSGSDIVTAGAGEWLNMGGTDRSQVFDAATADILFAPGYEAQRTYALGFFPQEADSHISEGALRSWMAGMAVCTWADAWVAADNAGDPAARAAAATTLAEAATWKDIVENDFFPSTTLESGEQLSYRWWVRPLADAAQAGDRAALLDVVANSGTCSYHVLPTIDIDPDYQYAGVR